MATGRLNRVWNSLGALGRRVAPALLAIPWSIDAASVHAERWYGNGQVAVSETRANLTEVPASGSLLTNVFLNVEDAIFYKTFLRLAGRFDWRKDLHSSYRVTRPTGYLDLAGYGYALTNTYSQYDRTVELLSDLASRRLSVVSYRDWRSTLAINVPRYPWMTFSYSRLHSFHEAQVRSLDNSQWSFVGEAGYARERYSVEGNYNELHRFDEIRQVTLDDIRALSGTVSGTTPSWRRGNASASYNFYGTERDGFDSLASRSRTHSFSGAATALPWRTLGFSASYSGRFTTTTLDQSTGHSRSEVASAGATWTPVSVFSTGLVQVYQVEGNGVEDILQYLTLSGSYTQSLRHGVDTRLSMSRTLYQQSDRALVVRDSAGQALSEKRLAPYTIDTYFGGFGVWVLPYVDLLINASLTRDPESPEPDQRYQMSTTVDGRLFMAAHLEGRVSYLAGSWGSELRDLQAHTETVNSGLSWVPRRNLNLSASYIVSSYATGPGHTVRQLGFYLNYSFRRAFTFFASFNQQAQELNVAPATPGASTLRTLRPRNTNIQLMIYTGGRSTLTLGYLDGRSNTLTGVPGLQSTTWSGSFNFQL